MYTIPLNTNNAGLDIPAIGLGTWGMGGYRDRDPYNDDEKDINAIRAAIKLGITHIDTAELYAAGHSEKLVGQAIEGLPRTTLQIATKVMGDNLSYDKVMTACEGSLSRLKTSTIDLYYIHWRNPSISLKETARALNKLHHEGLIKHVGVCNFLGRTMKELQQHLDMPIAANQSHYNLVYREPERTGLLEHCNKVGATFIAWRPIMWDETGRPHPNGNAWERGRAPLFDDMADQYGKPNVQLALNWLINQPNVSTLVKSSQPAHLKEILDCLSWSLSPKDIEILRAEFPSQEDVSSAVPLG